MAEQEGVIMTAVEEVTQVGLTEGVSEVVADVTCGERCPNCPHYCTRGQGHTDQHDCGQCRTRW